MNAGYAGCAEGAIRSTVIVCPGASARSPLMSTTTVKEEARRLIDRLPEDATWEDIQYEVYVRQAIEAGLKDSREGRTVPLADARRRFGLESS